MKIKIPKSDRKKALFVIDVQPQTLKNGALTTLSIIRETIQATHYPLYVTATYYAGVDSMLYKQNQWQLSKEEAGTTDENVMAEIQFKNAKILSLTKSGRSCFKSDQRTELLKTLKDEDISEIHMLGYDINDCVLATAYDAIDLGFYTYVLEEACNHYAGNAELVDAAIKVLRRQSMTNNSNLFANEEIILSLR